MEEFIYWRHIIPQGIKVEEISGRHDKHGAIWRTLAYQIYSENGKNGFREIEHSSIGAPLLYGEHTRISISHTDHLLVVASLPKTPDADLLKFNPRTALGVDTERIDRAQILPLRQRFMSDDELAMTDPDSILQNIQMWTAKEALLKAALTPGLDYRNSLQIVSLPPVQTDFPLSKEENAIGKAILHLPEGDFPIDLISYISDEEYLITLAFSPKCAKYKKG